MNDHTDDLRITAVRALPPPREIIASAPVDAAALTTIATGRQAVHRVLHGADDRLITVVGPCSIHDAAVALEYACRLREAALRLERDLVIVMRA